MAMRLVGDAQIVAMSESSAIELAGRDNSYRVIPDAWVLLGKVQDDSNLARPVIYVGAANKYCVCNDSVTSKLVGKGEESGENEGEVCKTNFAMTNSGC